MDEETIMKEYQPITITMDEETSMDTDKVVDPSNILNNEKEEHEPTSYTMDEIMTVNKILSEEEERDDEKSPIIIDEPKGLNTEDEKDEAEEEIEENKVKLSFWRRPCLTRPSCPSGLFVAAIPVTLMIVGFIYTYNGYSSSIKNYDCTAQPLLPVFMLVCGILLVLNVLLCQFHNHIDERIFAYFLIYGISPILLFISTIMIIMALPPSDDSNSEDYCPPFLYWLFFTCSIIGILFYSCVGLFFKCAHGLLGR